MENHIEILDLLMSSKKEKKKKDPNAKERKAFHNAWVSLASEYGFAGRAEQLLYEGFSFCGAEPFYAYLIQAEDQNATLSALFSGKYYGNDRNVTFRLVTHLLALLLNNNAPGNVLAPIIKRLPTASTNKDKKRLGTAEKTVEKYFLAELMPGAVLCPLADIGTKSIFIREFVDLFASILDGIESSGVAKDAIADSITKTRKWFADYEVSQSNSPENKPVQEGLSPVAAQDHSEVIKTAKDCHETGSKAPVIIENESAEQIPTDMAAHLIALLNKAGKAALAVKADSIQQRSKIDQLTYSIECEQEKLKKANQQLSEQQDTISGLRAKISLLESDIVVLRQELAVKDAVITEKTAEIEERIKMADVLSRDRSNQANETLQRIASKIRVEYRDFKDAWDIPMSCDLGENLRLQLQSVFDILEKGGMKIK